MNEAWLILINKFGEAGSRSKFEEICESLYRSEFQSRNVRKVKVNKGDGGIDIFIGEIGIEPIDVIQCKFFINGVGESQKSQIRESFKTVINSKEFKTKSWTLCIINTFDLQQNKWWCSWKRRTENEYNLTNEFIKLKDGNELVYLLKKNNLYTTAFEIKDSIKLEEIYKEFVKKNSVPEINIKTVLKNASYALRQVKYYIENKTSTHIQRSETVLIYDWINTDLHNNKKNVLILKGEKGLGKSVILKDIYEKLENENYTVLGIKADKFYCKSIFDLETQLFNNQLTFDRIIKTTKDKGEKLVVIIDQIDAMSLTLSSSREFIETYIRLISSLEDNKNVRVILSSRSYDLEYDAELSIYNSDVYKKISVNLFSIEEVKNSLSKFNISCSSAKVLELLRTPNHLDIYCRIFESGIKKDLNSVSTLKDLYDQLWKKYISSNRNMNLKKFIYLLSKKMYNEQRISVGNIYEDEYFSEINYLCSHSLLNESNKDLQFFHQTFYEYCFARQFVENQENLESYIIHNEQSLYVRSVIKMVLEYLREYNITIYLKTVKNIINSNDYRFHIKSLIISEIGLLRNPSISEKEFVSNIILKNKEYENVFVSSIFSESWIQFFISKDIPRKYFFIQENGITNNEFNYLDNKINYNWLLFRDNMNECPLLILDYFDKLDFENKKDFIYYLIIQIDNWDDIRLLYYFEKYIPYEKESERKRNNFWYYEILKKIFPVNKKYVYNKLKQPILDFYENYVKNYEFNNTLNNTLEKFFKDTPKETFEYLLKLYQQLSEKNKIPYFNNESISSPLYSSSIYIDSLTYGENNIKKLLYEFIESCDTKFITEFYNNHKNSNNVLIIKLIVKGLNTNPGEHKDLIIELLDILSKKNVFSGCDDNLQLLLRKLISNVYEYLNVNQTKFIDKTLLSIRSTYDYYIWTDNNGVKKYSLREFGEKKYLFIKSLPIERIRKNASLYRVYQELNRKFGEVNHSIAIHTSRNVLDRFEDPVDQLACDKMDMKNWKKSMIKYDEDYPYLENYKENIIQHSLAFSYKVKECPDKFYTFINELFDDARISPNYIIYGILGLIEGNFDPDKVKILYKKFMLLNLKNAHYVRLLNQQAKYFIRNKNIDLDIINFLKNKIFNYPNSENEYDSTKFLFDDINSIRRSALHTIMSCNNNKNFEEIVFSTVEKFIQNPLCNDTLKILILNNLGYLNYLDIERAFKIFVEITQADDINILKSSLNIAQYFNNKYHDDMNYYFDILLNTPELYKQCYIMVSSWLLGLDHDKKLYKKFITYGKNAKLCAIIVAEKFLINQEDATINKNALSILYDLINEEDKDLAGQYACIFLRKFKCSHFVSLFDFLKEYSKSKLCRLDPKYFLDYLLNCSKYYPKDCMELLENMDFRTIPNIQECGYYDKEPVQLILGIYSKLVSEINKDKYLINKALNIFDSMLKHVHLRNSANKAIETII